MPVAAAAAAARGALLCAAAAGGGSGSGVTRGACSAPPAPHWVRLPSSSKQWQQQAAGLRGAWAPQPLAGSAAAPRQRARAQRVRAMWGADGQEADEAADYYAILDVPSTASTDEIKRAYRRLAKEFHPDVSADESNTEFQMFLNDVYQTLLDPEKRAAYDMIAGFQIGGVNPFMDTSYERDMVFVDEFTCIGCRNCNNVCPKTYEMEDEWGRARVMQQGVDGTEKLQESIDTCPVSCIHWVTAPQLALLEETMARMERVAAFLLLNNGGKGANLNVFVEASIAWQKRQSALVAKAQAAQGWGSMFTSPAAGSSMQDAARAAAEGGGASSALGRGINAASVAAAARRWRDYQRAKRTREQRLLTVSSSASVDASVDAALQSSDV